MTSPWQQLRSAVDARPSSPFLTWYGPDTRTELSVLTYANAVAKTVGFLQDEIMLEPGDDVSVPLGMHWQSVVWLGACATLGLSIDLRPTVDQEHAPEAVVGFDAADLQESEAAYKVVVSDHPMGLPGAPLPAGFVDHARDVMGQPDVVPPDVDSNGGMFQLTDSTGIVAASDISELVATAIRDWRLPESATLLAAPVPGQRAGWLAAWAVPLATAGHAVLCDPALPMPERRRIAESEHVSASVPLIP